MTNRRQCMLVEKILEKHLKKKKKKKKPGSEELGENYFF